ncbi:alanine racemase [Thermocaproicibacter melissae]|jgi:alanine racemase|uniref:alanine racemase n=1 Tax=Thermocaproicibacter melissae TaxID=2966552 RepID=UPI0024B045EB|nr:alanine racemase [Thermocaproicibacter melissae]WBY64354.1 alanine racemase [Thermocaproicibacter melissae]
MNYLRRTWAEIDLDAVESNYRAIRSCLLPGTKVCCVVKADAYGHGAEQIAVLYEKLGADWLAVSNLDEAEQVRRVGVQLPILILGYTQPDRAKELAENRISQAVVGPEFAAALSEEAVKAGVTVNVHIQVDTGMSRVGFFYQNPARDVGAIDEMERACRLPGLNPEGIFTHFASADEGEAGADYTRRQFACFTGAIERLAERGVRFSLRHCANSAAVFDYPEMQLDMVRPGIILYGMMPSGKIQNKVPLTPVMSLKSTVALVKSVPAGTCVSYGRRFTSSRETLVATVPIGYADGYLRRYGENACALVRGKRAPVIGRVCMDQLMLDVTDVPDVQTGDTVTLMGRDGEQAVTADEIAERTGTINYEIVCGVATRVPRVFKKGGNVVGCLDYLQRA